MKTQKVLFHKEVEDELDYISEICRICGEELIRVEDIFIGREDDMIYCLDCAKYHRIRVVECKGILGINKNRRSVY